MSDQLDNTQTEYFSPSDPQQNIFSLGLSNEADSVGILGRSQVVINHYFDLIGLEEKPSLGRLYAVQFRKLCEQKNIDENGSSLGYTTPYGWEVLARMEHDPEYAYTMIPGCFLDDYKAYRIKLIRRLIARNVPIPESIVNQYPSGYFDVDFKTKAKERKALWTTSANRTGREDDSLVAEYGVMLRRQDGKKVGEKERFQVKKGLEEIIHFMPDLPDLCRAKSLTIIHTGGKNIYRSPKNTLGVYNTIHKTITVGVAGHDGEPDIRPLAHELLGHWLDYISIPTVDILTKAFGIEFAKIRDGLTVSYLDALHQGHLSTLYGAVASMIPVNKKPIHFARPSEVFARLAELYFSTSLFAHDVQHPVSVYPLLTLIDRQPYWTTDDWCIWLMGEAKSEIESRHELARIVNGLPIDKPDRDITYPYYLPWSSANLQRTNDH